MGDLQTLIEMGFPEHKAAYALRVTSYNGIEPAMEWLLAHEDEEIPKESEVESGVGVASAVGEGGVDPTNSTPISDGPAPSVQAEPNAKSLVCDVCGKLCKDQTEAEFHAVRTQHKKFSESTEAKPLLTEEEKRVQLTLIEERLKQKRAEREERDKVDALERERNRIKSGKDMTEARKRMEEDEMKKIVEQRKREKAEDKAARDRVRAQIEADKAARKARTDAPTAQTEQPLPDTSTAATVNLNRPAIVKPASKDYAQTRIQIRLQDGSTLVETFNVKEQLSAVRVFIQIKTGIEEAFGLMTSFPRRVFNDEDYEKPLDILGLVPSAVVIMTKI